jgi:hypothetical protein
MIEIEDKIEVMYFHGKTVDGVRYTVSGVVKDDDLQLGISICSDKQQFRKKRGREISSGRVLNQRQYPSGRIIRSLYSDDMGEENRGQAGYPENYFVGKEIKVFTTYVKNFNHFTKKELQVEFRLLKTSK